MVWFKLTLATLAFYMAQSYYFVSDSYMKNFLIEHNNLRVENPTLACEQYSENVIIDVHQRSPKGNINVSGGKQQICDYLKSGETVLGSSHAAELERIANVKVSSSFPWQSATAKYDSISAMNIDNIGTINSETHQVIEIKRGLLGPKMVALTSTGGVSF